VLATAGLELFAGDPIVGIGWQRSPLLIADPTLNDSLQRRFGNDINPEFLPEKNPTGVHNFYVQMLAEAGLVGMLCFLAFLFRCGLGIRDALRDLRAIPAAYETVRACSVMLVVLMIWWNDNALYGGQPESVIAATLIGVIAASTFAVKSAVPYEERLAIQRPTPGNARRGL
jgi:O-antigen ligase